MRVILVGEDGKTMRETFMFFLTEILPFVDWGPSFNWHNTGEHIYW